MWVELVREREGWIVKIMYEAKVIADSVCNDNRLTTLQVTHPRIIHSEFLTHAMFARNASSSRAIPFKVAVQRVMDDPFIPERFGTNKKGMQAGEDLVGVDIDNAISLWLQARDQAIACARVMSDVNGLNVHKQIVNRLIEPWSWITVCVTGDASAWSNYFALRCHKDAQPDIQKQAYMAQLAYYRSEPVEVSVGEWHTPYIREDERAVMLRMLKACDQNTTGMDIIKVSVGRCARTSYLTQEGVRDVNEDVNLHDRLANSNPGHYSPFEHVCMAMGGDERYGKYKGWKAYRHMLKGEYVEDFKPNHPELVKVAGV